MAFERFDSGVHVILEERVDPDVVSTLLAGLDSASIPVRVDTRPESGPWASVEWFLPTAAIVYLAKPYFEGFLKEAGKDHYGMLKAALKPLWSSFFGPTPKMRVTVISSSPKKLASDRYSLAFSVMVEGKEEKKFKLCLPEACTESEYDAAVEAFLEFMLDVHRNRLDDRTMALLEERNMGGKLIPVAHNRQTNVIDVLDPRPLGMRDSGAAGVEGGGDARKEQP